MKRYLVILSIVLGISNFTMAQVGINNTHPDASSVMDLKSTFQGLLIPRMTSAERSIMTSFGNVPANSLLIFDTDKNKFFYYNSTISKWLMLNPWYSDESKVICYGDTTEIYTINIQPTGGSEVFKVYSSYNGVTSGASDYQTEFMFIDDAYPSSGVKFNAKVSGGHFNLMQGFDKNSPVFTLLQNGNLGLGYTNPSKRLEVDGDIKSSSTVTATEFIGDGAVPVGTIIMWSGSIINIPQEWALCDGTNGTPDLRGKFIAGAGASYSVGHTGGEEQHTLTVDELPSHNHSGTASTSGSHWHYVARNQGANGGGTSLAFKKTGIGWESYDMYRHSSSANWGYTNYEGDHSHTFTTDNTGGGQAHENRPPYYTLAYIMRIN